jgi:superfamily I DNA and/or RNA helicase
MFSVSNKVAYDGLMVYGTKPLKDEKLNGLPPSGWIHVTGKTSQGHWVHDEGVELENLLKTLLREHQIDPMDIFLISPFTQVVSELIKMGRRYALDTKHHVGTIHTTQGKESPVVILVLGGDPKRGGAKDWAAQKPNLLNVAASRAKSRLYVIANREEWGKRPHFSVAKRKLPEITIQPVVMDAEASFMDPFAF